MADIAIVGGGIAGLYCARELGGKHRVTLYECLRRLGGRIETQDLQGFKAECGPMRFERKIEPLFNGLAAQLGVIFVPFTPPQSGLAKFPKYSLQPKEFSSQQGKALKKQKKGPYPQEVVSAIQSHHTSALDLLKFGIYRILNTGSKERRFSLAEVVSGGGKSKISQYAGGLTESEIGRAHV